MGRTRKIFLFRVIAWLCWIFPAGNLTAHDFWIEPSQFRASIGEPVQLTLRVGQDFGGDSLPYITDWFSDYRVIGPQEEYPIEGIIGDDPAGEFTARTPGYYGIGYRSTQNFVELEPTKFHDYLAAEGLTEIIKRREENGQDDSSGRELYSRCAKSLVKYGEPDSATRFDAIFGYTLELIPELNPYTLAPGDELAIRLLYESKPLEGVLIIAFTSDRPEHKLEARTDDAGRVELALPHSGIWLIKAVHMIARPPSDKEADWESFWASLTFYLPPAS
jgi:uncharacterized GH25 family protein